MVDEGKKPHAFASSFFFFLPIPHLPVLWLERRGQGRAGEHGQQEQQEARGPARAWPARHRGSSSSRTKKKKERQSEEEEEKRELSGSLVSSSFFETSPFPGCSRRRQGLCSSPPLSFPHPPRSFSACARVDGGERKEDTREREKKERNKLWLEKASIASIACLSQLSIFFSL